VRCLLQSDEDDRVATRYARTAATTFKGDPVTKLAKVMFQAAGMVHGIVEPLWEHTRPEIQHYFLERAEQVIRERNIRISW
jgi:hypothetical protein